MPELRFRLPCSPEFAPCCLRGAHLFWCSTVPVVPPPSLTGSVGGSGVPNRSRVAPVGCVPPCADTLADVAHAHVAPVGGAPVPLGGIIVSGVGESP